jgi:hypothetical protein
MCMLDVQYNMPALSPAKERLITDCKGIQYLLTIILMPTLHSPEVPRCVFENKYDDYSVRRTKAAPLPSLPL